MPRDKPSLHGRSEKGGKGGALVLLVVIIVIGIIAYSLFFSGPPSVANSASLLAQSDLAIKSIGKESFTYSGAIETTSEGKYFGFAVSGEGRIDVSNKRMYFKVNFENPVTEPGAASNGSVTLESYTVGDDVYINVAGNWGKYKSPGRLWGDVQFSQKMIELAKGFDSTVGGKETVNGKETTKVMVTPTLEDLVKVMSSMDPGLMGDAAAGSLSGIDKGIKSIKMNIWIGTADFLPVKMDGILEAETNTVSPSGVGSAKSDIKMSMSVNLDYKTPFNIVLPSAAQSAVDILPAA